MSEDADKLRLDKWLWFARFFKTRTLAASRVAAGDIRLNGERVTKGATSVQPGDVLTFSQGRSVRVIEVVATGFRRGPAPEAQALFNDIAPNDQESRDIVPKNPKFEGKGRPTKRDRRRSDLSRSRHLE